MANLPPGAPPALCAELPPAGLFISFEGADGCGKTTQSRLLAETLRASGLDVVHTREPGGSVGAEEIRRLLVEGEMARWSPISEALLFCAARRDHLDRTILPALERGDCVITDRFADSTRVYQGVARASMRPLVDALHELSIGVEPHLTFVLDLAPDVSLARGLARGGEEMRFESAGLAFQEALACGFRELARSFPERCHLVDAARSTAQIAAEIHEITLTCLAQRSAQRDGG